MSKSELNLNAHHEQAVVDYIKFARHRRQQCVRSVKATFDDTLESRLDEGTFTAEEVKEIITGLQAVVHSDVESELLHTDHCSVLLLKQLCSQAEHWHLKLQPDTSELQNRELVEQIARVEAQVFSETMPAVTKGSIGGRYLQPLQDTEGIELLRKQLSDLQTENSQLQEKLKESKQAAVAALREKEKKAQVVSASPSPSPMVQQGEAPGDTSVVEIKDLKEQLADMQAQLQKGGVAEEQMKQKLDDTMHQLLKVTNELEQNKEELDKKLADTSQYSNMMKMMKTKNAQLNELRTRLKKYEPDAF